MVVFDCASSGFVVDICELILFGLAFTVGVWLGGLFYWFCCEGVCWLRVCVETCLLKFDWLIIVLFIFGAIVSRCFIRFKTYLFTLVYSV